MGCRVLKAQPALVEMVLRKGFDAIEPVDSPKDLELVSCRMNFSGHPMVELLVKSTDFDGSDTDTFETAKPWVLEFRRTVAGGRRK